MNLEKTVFVLGGMDTEMGAIIDLLTIRGLQYTRARDSRGRVVSRSDAYDTHEPKLARNQVWVECRPRNYSNTEMLSLGYKLVDHHNEGDPGYNQPASRYWEASSIGQVCKLIGEARSPKLEMIAAADHCLHQAYNNGCHPIKREALLAFRLGNYREGMRLAKQRFQKTVDYMKANRTTEFNGVMLANVDALHGTNMSFFVTDASAYANIPFISMRYKEDKGNTKVFIGSASRKTIDHFLNGGASQFGETLRVYGDPSRHFAGAYVKRDEDDVHDSN